MYVRTGRLADAERVERESIDILERSLGRNHTAYAGAVADLGEILMERGRYDEAIAARQRAMDIRRRIFGPETALYGLDLARLARVYARKHDFATADSLFRVALANQRQYVSETHHDIRQIYTLMSERYKLEGNRVEAERYTRLAQPI